MWSLYAGDASTDIKPQGDFVSLYLHYLALPKG